MTRFDHNSNSGDDVRLDELLNRFFAQEMPVEFRDESMKAAPSQFAVQTALECDARKGQRSNWIMPALASLALLLVAGVLWFASARDPRAERVAVDGSDALRKGLSPVLPAENSSTVPVAYSLSQNVKPVESVRYDTLQGTVEQRTNLNTTNVSFIEPESGDLMELSLPELVIEVFPIDEDGASHSPAPVRDNPSAERRDGPEPASKLPEEGKDEG